MVRRHGWQLPAHAFQVVAITLFFLLAVAFYVFLAPFLGSTSLEYASIALYSPVALAVFLLYIRCSAIDPCDPGIYTSRIRTYDSKNVFSDKLSSAEAGGGALKAPPTVSGATFCCAWASHDDSCHGARAADAVTDDDYLFCTLCNAEVRKYSKHCRSCDKCVDGFDHHCRWLNNCVGKKNYMTFVSLMATSLTLLLLEWGMGTAVLVHCFVNKSATQDEITRKLGDSFTRAPFAAVVVCCTLVSLLASLPLGELFFFHVILIRKGITTYEYVVAMRAQSEAQGVSNDRDGDASSVLSSPTSSNATGLSVSSSLNLGMQYRGAWCTPPRIFVDEDEIVPHLGPGKLSSTIDPDSFSSSSRREPRSQKRSVKISAWKLARLNPEEAAKAAMRARASSSILRPVAAAGPQQDLKISETEYGTSSNVSTRSSVSNMDIYGRRFAPGLPGSAKLKLAKGLGSACSSPSCSGKLSPLRNEQKFGVRTKENNGNQWLTSDGYEASGCESVDGVQVQIPSVLAAGVAVAAGRPAAASESEKLLYRGSSIFYGGPMITPRVRADESPTCREQQQQQQQPDLRFFTRTGVARSQQSPVFVPRH